MKKSRLLLIFIALIVFITQISFVNADEWSEDEPFQEVLPASRLDLGDKPPKIDAWSAIVMDTKSGRVLYQKNAGTQRAIASTTKIITALVAIENGNLNDIVTISKKAAAVGGSTIKLRQGEKLSLKELLYGMMLKSGNDAAVAIAEHIGGTTAQFAEMMTERAHKIGAINSSFKNPHGLDVPGHYSTAYDMALITRTALKNTIFATIVSTKSTSITGRSLYNTNELLGVYPGADGVKTGYTGDAGRCLIASATREGNRFISVVLNCPTRSKRANDSREILDYAFSNYKQKILIQTGKPVAEIPVIRGIKDKVELEPVEAVKIPMTQYEINNVKAVTEIAPDLQAPVYSGIEAGTIHYLVDGKEIAKVNLKTVRDIRKKVYTDYLADVVKSWVRLMRSN